MSLSATSLNPNYLARIKAAVLRAVTKAHKPDAPHGVGQVEVYNRRARLSLVVVARKRGGFEIFDQHDRDVTGLIKSAMVTYHAAKGV